MSNANSRVHQRMQDQRNMYIEENNKLQEQWQRQNAQNENAAAKAAANKENDLIGAKDAGKFSQNNINKYYRTPAQQAKQNVSDSVAEKAGVEEDVFDKIEKDYLENLRNEEEAENNKWAGFGDEILKTFNESDNYIIDKQAQGKIVTPKSSYGSKANWYGQTPEEYLMRYNAAEDYVMSDGENVVQNVAKGTFNRFRSAPGEAIENFAFLIKDYAPWYKPAQDVINKNTARNIGNTATGQFNLAKEDTGYFGDRLIDASDAGSSMLGYAMAFGPSNLALSQGIGGGLDEYRYQRESGADKAEALTKGVGTGLISYGIERLGGLGADNSVAPKVNFDDVVSVFKTITKTALQEGGEEAAEYTANSLMNSLADTVYKGKISIDWNAEDAFNSAVTGAMFGGGLAAVPTVNGRDIDIVEEMNKIVTENTDVDTKIANVQKLKDSLSWQKKAEKEVDKLLWALDSKNKNGVKNVTRNAIGFPVITVEHINPQGKPYLITQNERAKGGIVRNYYGKDGKQIKQVVNFNEDGDKMKLPVDERFEQHTHDYHWEGNKFKRPKRRPNLKEWWENADIL